MALKTVTDLFSDKDTIKLMQSKLPTIFEIAEIESSRAGKIGMEVGSLRERALTALLILKFGKSNVNSNIPIMTPEVDVIVMNKSYSIKTITGEGGIKAAWTVDWASAQNFIDTYKPKCDMILAKIVWGRTTDGLYLIPLDVQNTIFSRLGKNNYFKMPKKGTNPRGVEYSKQAISAMMNSSGTKRIMINWVKSNPPYDVFERWVDYWK